MSCYPVSPSPPRHSRLPEGPDAHAQALTKLEVLIFSPPSLSAFLPPIIKAQKFDQANGLDLSFPERTPDAYTTQFNSGEFKIGGAGTMQLIAIADTRGVKVRYLFNLFDYWGAVVTSRDSVKTLKDIEGKEIAAARSTTNYQMFEFFAKRQGVDISKFKVVNTATRGPGELRHRRPRRRHPDLGAGLHSAEVEEAGHPHARSRHRRRSGRISPRPARAFPISASPPMPNGPTRIPNW